MKNDVGRLDRLITDISNASRLDAELTRDDPRPIALEKLLREIVGLYESVRRGDEPNVRLIATEGDPVMVSGREGPLGQVVRNLIDNARSFSPKDGPKGGGVRVTLARTRTHAVITVEDDGPGMPPENLETVFQRFYTSRPKGAAFGGNSGLGLSIARQIVEAHGGKIHAENRVAQDEARSRARALRRQPADVAHAGIIDRDPVVILHGGLVALRRQGLWRGVLIEGPSGAGKSDLALRALDGGFRLVADDRTLVWTSGGALYGRAPDALAGLIEARGLGVLRETALPFAEIALLAECVPDAAAIERMPEPEREIIAGAAVAKLRIDPFEAAAPAKLRRAIEYLGAAE